MAQQPKKGPAKSDDQGGKPIMVVEGDSWESLPFLGMKGLPTVGGSNFDLSRALANDFDVRSLAHWGDTIAAIARNKDYLAALVETGAEYLLLGGGGNDLLAGGNLRNYLRLYRADRAVADYVTEQFYLDLQKVIINYRIVLADISAQKDIKHTKVIVHGYDYAKPMRLGWLGEPMRIMGINDIDHPDLQIAIVQHLIDGFNHELKRLAAQQPNVIYVDFRGLVKGRWHDELHPTKEAFIDLARHLISRL